jgi:hypothetical protein
MQKAGTPSATGRIVLAASRFSSEKKLCPSVTIRPKSRVQAWSMRG